MAIWKVSNSVPKSLAEREIWTHPDKGEVVRETLFRHGAYLVVTEDDSPPEFEREAVPGGDGAQDSVDLNFCGYDTQLIELIDGCNLIITWPDGMGDAEKQALIDLWDGDGHDAWESEGWELDDTEVWFWDDLNIELLESGSGETQAQTKGIDEGWISSETTPKSKGIYAIETAEKVDWPNFPMTEASWNGKEWLDDDGKVVNVKCWRPIES
jgi:hypothetical protein